jgi:NADH dehydrogenase [ubiquinone] 1 alpha subcomplex assembly factor 5
MLLHSGRLRHLYALSRSKRLLASVAGSGAPNPLSVGPFRVFDREAKTLQKNRAAVLDNGQRSRTVDYVREEVADRLLERLMVSDVIAT